jgi:uncharacterized LabA/DUF88 family protein
VKTWVYVDAFNLYYGAVKSTRYRWLDIARMCRLLLPNHEIQRIKYFSAQVSARPDDPRKPVRQQIYFRALRTLPNLEIILGHFLSHVVSMPLAQPDPGGPRFVRVVKTEEKGSDVNLATHLLNDAYLGRYEVAVVVSADSDLLEPVRIVTGQLRKPIGVLNPQPRPSKVLCAHATFVKQIRAGVLAASQLPATLTDEHGTFKKPEEW